MFVILSHVLFERILKCYRDIKSIKDGKYFNLKRRTANNTWLAYHFAIDTLRYLLPASYGGSHPDFVVTGLHEDVHHTAAERKSNRLPLMARMQVFCRKEGIFWYPVTVGLVVAAMVYRFCHIEADDFWTLALVSVLFPGHNLVRTLCFFMSPIFYCIWPPSMPDDRRDLMVQDDNGVWRPRKEAVEINWTVKSNLWLEVPDLFDYSLVVAAWVVALNNLLG
jgi:hypothetical protein